MLLAVEGGGFFSSSASGYSHGLALLLLGRKNEEKVKNPPVKVSPFNSHYHHLVKKDRKSDQENQENQENQEDQDRQLATCKCTILGCFSSCSDPSETVLVKKRSEKFNNGDNYSNSKRGCLKSNLKRDSSERCLVSGDAELARESVEEEEQGQNGNFAGLERRKVQWTDTCGKDLVEIREFEASERGASDDESENDTFRKCECAIM
ncbi:hypothetical protein LUZ60_008530 [Juncus effusus]|nr:hypothetical protein LUZ60_008530 [Juncus effusus]